jgi:hypothetical protein
MCHAGTYRIYGLCSLGHSPYAPGWGMGRTEDIDSVAMELMEKEIIPEIEILLPNLYNRESALAAIRRGLQDVADKYGDGGESD